MNLPATRMTACIVAMAASLVSSASAQTATDSARPSPNVPAMTGDRQQVPMGGNDRPGAAESTQGSSTGLVRMEQRPRLREFALRHRDSETKMRGDIRVGTVLPEDAKLLDIPSEFGLDRYRLALANQLTLLVDPSTRRVEEVIR